MLTSAIGVLERKQSSDFVPDKASCKHLLKTPLMHFENVRRNARKVIIELDEFQAIMNLKTMYCPGPVNAINHRKWTVIIPFSLDFEDICNEFLKNQGNYNNGF